jgi:hypothetical protein
MQDDCRYFDMHRDATFRVRLPFPGELLAMPAPIVIPPGHAAVVIVTVRRNKRTLIRARGVAVVPCSQGLQ